MPSVKQERTGWRDAGLSQRHRAWGFDCPAIDLDFVMLEFDNLEPVALVEYKRETAKPIFIDKAQGVIALARLGTRANIPAFLVRYATDFSWFKVCAINDLGKAFVQGFQVMGEQEYVSFLYALRGRSAPKVF